NQRSNSAFSVSAWKVRSGVAWIMRCFSIVLVMFLNPFRLRCRCGILFFFPGGWRARLVEQIAPQGSQTLIPLCFNGPNPGRDGRERLWSWHIPPLPTHLVDRHETCLL